MNASPSDKPVPYQPSERKLTTIVAADVAGYSRLTSRYEEGTLSALRKHRTELIDPLLKRFRGRLANTAGDSLLIEFPSVVDALRCAIELQSGMLDRNAEVEPEKRIEFRVGINVGDVLIQDGDLLGNGINVAARLETVAQPGGICISRSARDQIRHLHDIRLEDLGEVEVKNIDRPVRAFRVLFSGEPSPPPVRRLTKRFPVAAILAVSILAALVVAIGILYGGIPWSLSNRDDTSRIARQNTNLRPAMIVLPFVNMSKDPEQDYFSDGITEDLTTSLARIPGLLVTARNTAFTFKGKSVDARQLGTQLGVRYVLEGSARKRGDRLRLNAQLIETATGTHVWAETFDRPLKDIFIVQDELVKRIVGSVASRLRRREGQRALLASSETLAAYDLMSRARLLFRQNKLEAVTEARRLLRRSVTLDPSFAMAYSRLAQVENFFFTNRLSDEYARQETAKRVVEAAARASALAPEDASAHAVHGMALRLTGHFEEAAKEAKRARELAPNDPDVLVEIASVLISVGAYRDTVETVRLAWALDPYINPVFVGGHLSQALFALGNFKGAKDAALSCLKRAPNDVRCHESLVRALGELGPKEETREAVANILRISPNYTVSEYLRKANRNRRDAAAIGRWADGLRKAGIPE